MPLLSDIMPPREARMLLRAGGSAHGLILFCGPTGSGKTTTVFSTLSALNRPENNILTLEDPVEYELEGVNQAELDVHRDVGWDVLLKGFLRQDPDLGLIGEIRDLETASTAIRQALTGHVVFATLHTMSCARTVERMLDMGVDGDVLASALSLVVSQRLVRRLCPECRVSRPIAMQERRCFEARGMLVPARLHEPSECGCPHCRQGYRGRMAAVEMLPVTREVSLLVEARVRSRDYEAWMKQQGFLTLFESALRLVAEGHTSFAEAEEWKPVWDDFDFSA